MDSGCFSVKTLNLNEFKASKQVNSDQNSPMGPKSPKFLSFDLLRG